MYITKATVLKYGATEGRLACEGKCRVHAAWGRERFAKLVEAGKAQKASSSQGEADDKDAKAEEQDAEVEKQDASDPPEHEGETRDAGERSGNPPHQAAAEPAGETQDSEKMGGGTRQQQSRRGP